MTQDFISIRGAKQHNLKNVDLDLPKNKLVVLQGLHDFIVVEQNNMLLICPKDEEQSVKKIVADVKERFGPDFI
jgi:mannose-1-phosphate guanylyltransferase